MGILEEKKEMTGEDLAKIFKISIEACGVIVKKKERLTVQHVEAAIEKYKGNHTYPIRQVTRDIAEYLSDFSGENLLIEAHCLLKKHKHEPPSENTDTSSSAKIRDENEVLRNKVVTTNQEVVTLRDDLKKLRDEIVTARHETVTEKQKIVTILAKIAEKDAEIAKLSAEIDRKDKNIERLSNSSVSSVTASLKDTITLSVHETVVNGLQNSLRDEKSVTTSLREELKSSQSVTASLQKELMEAKSVTASVTDLKIRNSEATQSVTEWQSRHEAVTATATHLGGELKEAARKIVEHVAEIDSLHNRVFGLEKELELSAENNEKTAELLKLTKGKLAVYTSDVRIGWMDMLSGKTFSGSMIGGFLVFATVAFCFATILVIINMQTCVGLHGDTVSKITNYGFYVLAVLVGVGFGVATVYELAAMGIVHKEVKLERLNRLLSNPTGDFDKDIFRSNALNKEKADLENSVKDEKSARGWSIFIASLFCCLDVIVMGNLLHWFIEDPKQLKDTYVALSTIYNVGAVLFMVLVLSRIYVDYIKNQKIEAL